MPWPVTLILWSSRFPPPFSLCPVIAWSRRPAATEETTKTSMASVTLIRANNPYRPPPVPLTSCARPSLAASLTVSDVENMPTLVIR